MRCWIWAGVDTSKFVEGTVDSGKIDGKLVGINAGINSAVIIANPKVFEKAKMDLPDDTTWTWDELMEVGAEVASKAGVPFGVARSSARTHCSARSLRQHGKELFTPDGLGFDVADAQAWYDIMVKGEKAKAFGTPEQISEEGGPSAKPLDQSRARGRQGRHAVLQLQPAGGGQQCGRGEEMEMLRAPEPDRQGNRPQGLVQGEHAVVGLGQDQEPGGRDRLDQLVGERPGGRRHRQG